MMKRESFILYSKQLRNINKLSDEQAGKLLKAIYNHSQDEEVTSLDDVTDMLYGIIAYQMDEDTEKYKEVIEKRSKAGKASAEARANKKEQEEANPTCVKPVEQKPTPSTDNDNDNDNDNVYVNDNSYISEKDETTKGKKPVKSSYGKYKRVKLSKVQYDDMVKQYGKSETDYLIDEVDSYCERNNRSYSNYREAIATFVKRGALDEYYKKANSPSKPLNLVDIALKKRALQKC